jgi:hypothetical protein
MEDKRLWFLLGEVAARLDIEVRVERLGGDEEYQVRGGLCRFKDHTVIFVEKQQEMAGRCGQLGQALLGLELEGVYLRPALRDYLEQLGMAPGEEE